MCVLVNGEVECTTYQDNQRQIFNDLMSCEKQAEYRFYTMMDGFHRMNVPYEKIVIGCEGGNKS